MTDEGLFTVEEAARYLKLHPRTVSNKAQRGEIPARKIGGHWRFNAEDLRTYDEAQRPTERPEQA